VHSDGECNPNQNIIIYLPEYTVSHITSICNQKRVYNSYFTSSKQRIRYNIQLNVDAYIDQLYGLPQATRRNM
jgi:hypothetical protein